MGNLELYKMKYKDDIVKVSFEKLFEVISSMTPDTSEEDALMIKTLISVLTFLD